MAAQNQRKKYLTICIGLLFVLILIYIALSVPGEVEETRMLKLYFSYDQAQSLKAEMREVEVEDLYNSLVIELVKGPTEEGLGTTIPPETELLGWDLNQKELILDFNSNFRDNHWGGSTGEIMTVYSIVNTMAQLEEVSQVFFLIEGEEVETLVGHMSLDQAIIPNYKLIAD